VIEKNPSSNYGEKAAQQRQDVHHQNGVGNGMGRS